MGGSRWGELREEWKKILVAEFDINEDGILDAVEKREAKKARKAWLKNRRAALRQEADTNEDGRISEDEYLEGRRVNKRRFVEEFEEHFEGKDRDGKPPNFKAKKHDLKLRKALPLNSIEMKTESFLEQEENSTYISSTKAPRRENHKALYD